MYVLRKYICSRLVLIFAFWDFLFERVEIVFIEMTDAIKGKIYLEKNVSRRKNCLPIIENVANVILRFSEKKWNFMNNWEKRVQGGMGYPPKQQQHEKPILGGTYKSCMTNTASGSKGGWVSPTIYFNNLFRWVLTYIPIKRMKPPYPMNKTSIFSRSPRNDKLESSSTSSWTSKSEAIFEPT